MSEEFSPTIPSDRAVEQAIVALKKGAHFLKHGRRGKPKFCPFRLSADEKYLIWYSGQEEKQLRLSLVTDVIPGKSPVNFQRNLQPEMECQSFSLIYANGERSLDLICRDKTQANSWVVGLKAVISRTRRPRSWGTTVKTHRGAQSCVNSPASFARRKHTLGLSEESAKYSQVHSVSGSPTHALSDRCFSDGLSCSSDSFYSESNLSSMHSLMDMYIPKSPYIRPDDFNKNGSVNGRSESQTTSLSWSVRPSYVPSQIGNNVLRDVLIWGEGVEGGCLGGGIDMLGNHNEKMQLNALSPKLLESTMMLDVQNLCLGHKHAAIITKNGELYCWGEGKGGRLGHKVNMDVNCPKIVDSLTGVHVKSVACGEYQTCAVTLTGELYTWGDSCYGSDLSTEDSYRSQWLPHRLSGPLAGVSVLAVSCGEWHTAIVSTSGQLFTYGDGIFGVLGHGNTQSFTQPKEVESLKGLWVRSVACGPWHTAAIVEIMVDRFKINAPGGKLFTWGDGDKGRLGHANQERKLLPTCVAQLVDHDFVQISCGRILTVGLTNTGIVYTIGSSVHGQLGNPQAKDKSITAVQGKLKNERVREISSGSYHVAVLTSNGNVYTWGKGANGQLGLGDNEDRDVPSLVEALRDRQVESITCGSSSTAAVCLHKSISGNDQSACSGCSTSFGFTRKKYNCHNCGLSFCNACCSKKATNASLAPNKIKPFRVCDPCFNQLQRIRHSDRMSSMESVTPKLGSLTPRLLSTTREVSEEKEARKSFTEDKYCNESYTMVKQTENQQLLDPISSLLTTFPRWGNKIHYPGLSGREHQLSDMSFLDDQSSFNIALGSKVSPPTPMNTNECLSESDKRLIEEVQKLRAEAESLEMLCETRGTKIEECQRRIEESWSLAKEQATKCKVAKDVIKSLTQRLQKMSDRLSANDEVVSADTGSLSMSFGNHMFAKHLPPEVGSLEDRTISSVCSSPINTLKKSSIDEEMYNGESKSTDEAGTDCGQNENKTLKHEWVEQFESGVYITFTVLPSGQKGLKRVRFSRKKFSEKQAQRWWEENQLKVYQKHGVEGYSSSSQELKS